MAAWGRTSKRPRDGDHLGHDRHHWQRKDSQSRELRRSQRSPRRRRAAGVGESHMSPGEMQRLFEAHRDAEAARDYDRILATFVEDCFLETHPLGLRSEGRKAVRTSYEEGFFRAFPDLAPEDEGQ